MTYERPTVESYGAIEHITRDVSNGSEPPIDIN